MFKRKIVADSSSDILELENTLFAPAALPQVSVQIHTCRGLCSYYAEKGGLLVGYEKM